MCAYVYRFGDGFADCRGGDAALLGAKGAHLAAMARFGLPVPPGFTISAEAHRVYVETGALPSGLGDEVDAALAWLTEVSGRALGDPERPLVVSVRSGAQASMPGMMDTILNLGVTRAAVDGLARMSGDRRFALDCRRRFLAAFADAALGVDIGFFDDALEDCRAEAGLSDEDDLSEADLAAVAARFEAVIEEETGAPPPEDPRRCLDAAIEAVMRSWNNPRAKVYRAAHGLEGDWGVGVTVQRMVFGNLGEDSGTGVCFSRDPATGAPGLYGEYLAGAQGEDVVSGAATPLPIAKAARIALGLEGLSLEEARPEIHQQLAAFAERLEGRFRDLQDIEFTVEQGRLWLLQTRPGKRSARADLRIAVDLAEAGVISREEAVRRVDAQSLEALLHPTVDPSAPRDVIGRGLPASPGAAIGEAVFTSQEAEALAAQGRKAILIRPETSPEDIHGMYAAHGVLTARGGMTSHAAVVARGLGKPCVCGAGGLTVDPVAGEARAADGRVVRRGDKITIDGGAGEALLGAARMVEPELDGAFGVLMAWADSFRRMRVRANADSPQEAELARRLGAEGVGLCRTEHGFLRADRLPAMRRMILARTEAGRREALAALSPMQQSDLLSIFEAMAGLPAAIRLLDPPLHEFLPADDESVAGAAERMGLAPEEVWMRTREMREFNPMLGRRGCRLGVAYPEIYEMQIQAMLLAAQAAAEKGCAPASLEVIVPFIAADSEMRLIRRVAEKAAKTIVEQTGVETPFVLGAMVETPRCALRAGAIARHADFFTFGTNDLTQTAYGLSRDDAGRYMTDYVARGALPADPFHTLDLEGVGELVRIACERARAVDPQVPLSLCGEHGRAPSAIDFCEELGMAYVSCSPYRLPAARLAAAQAALKRRAHG